MCKKEEEPKLEEGTKVKITLKEDFTFDRENSLLIPKETGADGTIIKITSYGILFRPGKHYQEHFTIITKGTLWNFEFNNIKIIDIVDQNE